jgi:serine/threonine-protein kinase
MQDHDFVKGVIDKGWLTEEQIQECFLSWSVPGGAPPSIQHVLIESGLLTKEQAEQVARGDGPGKARAFGPYAIERKIGEGGMGVVYRARKNGEDRVVALKILPDRLADGPGLQRFEREAKIAIQLSHPNLVKAYEHGQIDGRHYYVMEFVEGGVLSRIAREKKRIDTTAALKIGEQIAAALEAIHAAGLVHRDIKPENIILREDGTAKLMDLGLVKSKISDDASLTKTGYAMGTLHYMSPEQLQGKDVDIRSDIYALGATLFFVLSGKHSVEGTTLPEILNHILKGKLTDIRPSCPSLSDSAAAVLFKMLALNPVDRYASPADLRADLNKVLEGRTPDVRLKQALASALGKSPSPLPRLSARERLLPTSGKKRVSWALWAGIAAAAIALVIVFSSLTSSPRIVRPPTPPVESTSDGEFLELVASGSFGKAWDWLSSTPMNSYRKAELESMLLGAARSRWGEVRVLAEAAAANGKFDEGVQHIRSFQEQARGIPDLFESPMRILLHIEEARKDYARRVAMANQDSEEAARKHFARLSEAVEVLVVNREFDRAIGAWEGARALAGEDAILRALIDREIQRLRTLAKEEKPAPKDLGALWNRMQEQRRQKDLRSALQTMDEILAVNPAEPNAHFERAELHSLLGNYDSAERDARRAADLEPTSLPPRLLLLQIYLQQEQSLEAMNEAAVILSIKPDCVDALLARAGIFAQTGRLAESRAEYDKVLRLDPKNAAALDGKAKLGKEPPQQKPEPKPVANPIEPKLRARLHASTEEFDLRKDGTIRFRLVYDFSKPEQLKDFTSHGLQWKEGGIVSKEQFQLSFLPDVSGDFKLGARFQFVNPPQDANPGIVLRFSSRENKNSGAAGHLLRDSKGWVSWISRIPNDFVERTENLKYDPASEQTMILERISATLRTGLVTFPTCSAKFNSEPGRLSVHSRESIRLSRLEIEGTFDPQWLSTETGLPIRAQEAKNKEAAPEASGPASEIIKKRLGEYFSADTERITPLADGTVRVELDYTFNSPHQLWDFCAGNAVIERGQLILNGSRESGGIVILRPPIRGDFKLRAEFSAPGVKASGLSGFLIRTASSNQVMEDNGKLGVVYCGRADVPGSSRIGLGANQKSMNLMDADSISARDRAILSLAREGSQYTASFTKVGMGAKKTECSVKDDSGPKSVWIRISALDLIHVDRLSLEILLDAETFKGIFGPSGGKEISLLESDSGYKWKTVSPEGTPMKRDGGTFSGDSKNKTCVVLDQALSPPVWLRFEAIFAIERLGLGEPENCIGWFLFFGDALLTNGNFSLALSKSHLGYNVVENEQLVWGYSKPVKSPLVVGAKVRLLLEIRDGDVLLSCGTGDPLILRNAIREGAKFRPALFLQNVKGSIVRVTIN